MSGGGTWSCVIAPIPEGHHTLTARQTDPAGNVSPDSLDTHVHVAIDTDNASAAIEDAGPNNGDGNGDGIKDSDQGNVTSIPNPVTGGYTTLEVTGGACPFVRDVNILRQADLPLADDGHNYPLGLWNYSFDCYGNGKQATVRIFLDKAYDTTSWQWRKFNSLAAQFSTMQQLVSYNTPTVGRFVTAVTYHVTEGGALDEDGIANGSFSDPNGPTFTVASSASPNPILANTGQNIFWVIGAGLLLMIGSIIWLLRQRLARAD